MNLCFVLQFLDLSQECKCGWVLENIFSFIYYIKDKGKNPYDHLVRVTKTFDKIDPNCMIKKQNTREFS